MKIKEITIMGILMVLMNVFLIKMMKLHGHILSEGELMWIMGFFTGIIATKLLIELINYYNDKED